jgi:hypothetical protein
LRSAYRSCRARDVKPSTPFESDRVEATNYLRFLAPPFFFAPFLAAFAFFAFFAMLLS